MTTTETTPGPLDVPAEPLDPPPIAWLPLTVGDGALQPAAEAPKHGRPGDWFIFLTNLTAFGLGAGAAGSIIALLFALGGGEWERAAFTALMAGGLAFGCVVQSALSRHVRSFSRWGWWGAMGELALVTLSKVNVLATNPDAWLWTMCGIAIDLVWIHYFWSRRADFGIDLDFDG